MGIGEKRARYKEKFRREILDAARALIVNEGYEKFSMHKLAAQTDYPATSIFKDKDELLFAICEEAAKRFFADLSAIRETHSDPIEALRQALLYLISFECSNPDEYQFLFMASQKVYGSPDEFMEKESMARNSYLILRDIVNSCILAGKLQEIDIDVLTQAFTVATHGLAALTIYKVSFPWVDRNVLGHTLIEGLLRGYRR